MIIQENDFLLNDAEISDLAQHIQPPRSRLALLPDQPLATSSGVIQAYEKMTEELREHLDVIVRGLAYPVRLMRLHYSIADETISRQLIVWSRTGDELVTLARNGNVWRASTNTEFGVRTLVREVLAAGSDLRRDPFCLSLSSTSVLVFLGILEQMRYVRLYSTLMGQSPTDFFAVGDVLTRMCESTKEDFRWPLAMFEKVLPVRMMGKVQLEDVIEGLNELLKVGLVEACDEKGQVYELSPAGLMVADGVLHEVSKVALCVSQYRPDGVVGHDAVLQVRSAFYLFLFELAGEAGVLATLDEEGADLFLEKTMETPDLEIISAAAPLPDQEQSTPSETPIETKEPPVAVTPQIPLPSPKAPSPVSVQAVTCSNCGKKLKPGAHFCPECGQKVAVAKPKVSNSEPSGPSQVSVCPRCGNPVKSNAKFCGKCGAMLQ
jgi:hypothetical protein